MDSQEFDEIFKPYEAIKQNRAKAQLEFYTDRVNSKRRLAQWSGAAVLFISLTIPMVTNFHPVATGFNFSVSQETINMFITLMSLSIALLSGLDGLHQWRTTWREYSKAIVRIETQIALWEVKVTSARELPNREEVSKALGDATEKLISEVEAATSAEMDVFFSARSAAEKRP